MDAWAKAKDIKEPKVYSAPRSSKKPAVKNPGINIASAIRQNIIMEK
jgi:hypothetical protein